MTKRNNCGDFGSLFSHKFYIGGKKREKECTNMFDLKYNHCTNNLLFNHLQLNLPLNTPLTLLVFVINYMTFFSICKIRSYSV